VPPPAAPVPAPAAAAPVASVRHPSAPPPRSLVAQLGARVRGEDLIADLFEAMHDLHFARDAVEAAEFCLALSMEKLPSQAGIVHFYDIDHRDFFVACTRGPSTSKLLLRRYPNADPLLSTAMRLRRALVLASGDESEGTAADRYAELGGVRSLVVAPVMQAGRFLGAIELLNPLDGQPFTDSDGNAVTYIAEQFAEFVSTHGIVMDPERIGARRGPES